VPGAVVRAIKQLQADPDVVAGDIYARLIATPADQAFATERGCPLSREEVDDLQAVLRRL
jgi:hypothetical protein